MISCTTWPQGHSASDSMITNKTVKPNSFKTPICFKTLWAEVTLLRLAINSWDLSTRGTRRGITKVCGIWCWLWHITSRYHSHPSPRNLGQRMSKAQSLQISHKSKWPRARAWQEMCTGRKISSPPALLLLAFHIFHLFILFELVCQVTVQKANNAGVADVL